mmetsp:Transcript_34670/g.62923  ORF Transcript_34670/g.62923 Transcript_34670/m.62923 type:complete len:252 (-) Transcript_34670:294-1049(-)
MASISQLGSEGVDVNPVDVGERSAAEEMSSVRSQCNGGDSTQDFALGFEGQSSLVNTSNGAISSSTEDVSIRKQRRRGHAKSESVLGAASLRSELLEESVAKLHLQEVAGIAAAVDKLIVMINENVCRDPLHLAEVCHGWPELLIGQVELPDTDVVVSACHQMESIIVEEANAVGGVCCCWRTADSQTSVHLPNNQAVVVLSAKSCQVHLVEREGQGGDSHFVQGEAILLHPCFKVPNDHVGYEAHVGLLS